MRVAHVVLGRCRPDVANGVKNCVYFLALNQARLGAEVAVFNVTAKPGVPIPGAESVAIPPSRPAFFVRLPISIPRLEQAVLDWMPDVVHFHSVHIGPFVSFGRRLRKKEIGYVVTPHGAFAPGRLARVGPGVRAYIRFFERPYLENSCFVHAVSQNDVAGLVQEKIKAKIVVIPNGIDIPFKSDEFNKNLICEWRRRFSLPEDCRLVGFLGRLDLFTKGLDLLLEAFAQISSVKVYLVLAGPDWTGSVRLLKERARSLGLSERVIFTGPVYGEQKWALLKTFDVFVHTSRSEAGTSVAVLEALAMGKPVLVTYPLDPDQKIERFGAGVVVGPDVDQIRNGLELLQTRSLEELQEMGRNAIMLVNREYNWAKSASVLLESYRRYSA